MEVMDMLSAHSKLHIFSANICTPLYFLHLSKVEDTSSEEVPGYKRPS